MGNSFSNIATFFVLTPHHSSRIFGRMTSPNNTAQQFEIEIKSLLGSKENADALQQKLKERFPNIKVTEESKQLNHYFVGESFSALETALSSYIPADKRSQFQSTLEKGKNISVRTRQLNDKVIFVMKASIDDTTSSNGISRLEFETEVENLTLDQLDKILLDAGFSYQAKWSRERTAYQTQDAQEHITVCLDKNAGYGYLAEFEALVENAEGADAAQTKLRQLMSDLGAEELAQDRLERMFAFYNANWPEYYGTDKVFTVE
jgi:predicted adenylyl cyclase CyaB